MISPAGANPALNEFDKNVIWPTDPSRFAFMATDGVPNGNVISWDTWHATYDLNSTEANPLFRDAANGDFRLRPGSPAIGAGVDVSLTSDYAGVTVPTLGQIDIGAYQWTGMLGTSAGSFLDVGPARRLATSAGVFLAK